MGWVVGGIYLYSYLPYFRQMYTFRLFCTNDFVDVLSFLTACPTCENFEEMQRLILELTYELNMVKDEITRLQQTNIIYENRVSYGIGPVRQ